MASEWREVNLDYLFDFGNGKSRPKEDGDIPVYGGNGILGYCNETNYDGKTIIIGRVGAYCGAVYYENNPIWVSDNAISAKPKNGFDAKYLYYLLKIANLNQHAGGSSQPLITQTTLKSLEYLACIDPSEQKVIAHILGSLDEKIELNRQINRTLEQMAQTMFKSWFVDFDPVIDNALEKGNEIPVELQERAEQRQALGASRKPLPDHIQKLFPSEFEFSEELNKWIPKGWKLYPLNNFINVKHGFAFKGDFFSDEPTRDILLTPGNFKIGGGFKPNKFKYYKGDFPDGYVLNKGDLIITMTDLSKEADTLGYPALVPETINERYLHNQRLGKVDYRNSELKTFFIYHCLCSDRYRNEIVGGASGTTVKHTSPTKILSHEVLLSEKGIELFFDEQAEALYENIHQNEQEIISLTIVRDTLLPKLISGEIRVSELKNNMELS